MNTPWKWVSGPVYEPWIDDDPPQVLDEVDWDYRGYGYNPCLVDCNGFLVLHAGNGEYSPCTKDVGEKLLRAINNHDALVEALEFYANEDNHLEHETGIGMMISEVYKDGGSHAREALAAVSAAKAGEE